MKKVIYVAALMLLSFTTISLSLLSADNEAYAETACKVGCGGSTMSDSGNANINGNTIAVENPGSHSSGGGGGGAVDPTLKYIVQSIDCYGQSSCYLPGTGTTHSDISGGHNAGWDSKTCTASGSANKVLVAAWSGSYYNYEERTFNYMFTPKNRPSWQEWHSNLSASGWVYIGGGQDMIPGVAGYPYGGFSGATFKKQTQPTYFSGCGYADWIVNETKTCFFDGRGSGSYSRNLAEIRNLQSGTIRALGPLPGSPTTGEHDNCRGSFYHSISVPTARYGYYSLYLTNQYKDWQRSSLVYGSRTYDTKWEQVGHRTQTKYGFYSFSCNSDNPYNNMTMGRDLNSTHNEFANKVNSQNVQNYLDPANCPQTKGRWECSITDASTIGLDRASVAGRTNVDDRRVSVMRNGDPVRLTYAAVQISDYDTAGRETIITPGASGSVVRNLQNVNYRDSVVGRGPVDGVASTPWNSSADVNAKSQYFARKATNGSGTTQWDQWVTNRSANDNRDYNLYFNWASDPAAPFSAAREYQVTADFLVPSGVSGSLDANGNFSGQGVTYDWKRDTRQCLEKAGSAGNLVETSTPIVSKTNPVDVLRATGENN